MSAQPEHIAVIALVTAAQRADLEWHRMATLIEESGSARALIEGGEPSGFEDEGALAAARTATPADLKEAEKLIDQASRDDARLVTVLDEDYPTNLRFIYNRPPFLFVRGTLVANDNRAIAVVGTRDASPEGVKTAESLGLDLARGGVTVLSGLAAGIDTAAHEGALRAGGRTIAVIGTGILAPTYPKQNADLAKRIVESGGAVVSQFWPKSPPAQWAFPMRNVVMSGMALGTVVVEASKTSGAKMQARLALEHGKRVFLIRPLVMREEWARDYAERRGAQVVETAEDVKKAVDAIVNSWTGQQLQLT